MIQILLNFIYGKYNRFIQLRYLNKINYLLNKNLKKNFTLLDIGAAGGVNNKWNLIKNKITLILVEPNKESAKRLKDNKLNVIEEVLHSEDNKKITFYNTKKNFCSSFYKPNFSYLKKFCDHERFDIVSEEVFISKSLDTEILNFDQPDFIKIDTEGSELDILKGSNKTLSNVFGLEIECSFHQIREKQPLFDDVRYFLENLDFVFSDFTTLIRWEKDNYSFSGQPQMADVLFLKNEEIIIEKFKKNEMNINNLLNYFVILIIYERVDILRYVKKHTDVSLKFIDEIIDILEKKTKRINKLDEVNYFIKNSHL